MFDAGFVGYAVQEGQHGNGAEQLGELYEEAAEEELCESGRLLPVVEHQFIADAADDVCGGQEQQMAAMADDGESNVCSLYGKAEVEVEEEVRHAAYA